MSISNNIAEGFERGTTQELITFLYIARGSASEVRSLTHLLERLPNFQTMRSEISDLRSQAVSISRQLHGWLTSLQNTDIKGHRYLNEKSRQAELTKREREEFLKELEEMRQKRDLKSQI